MENLGKETENDESANSEQDSHQNSQQNSQHNLQLNQAVKASNASGLRLIPIDVEDEIKPTIIKRWPVVTISVGNMEPLDLSQNRQSNTNMKNDNTPTQLENTAHGSSAADNASNEPVLNVGSASNENGHGVGNDVDEGNAEGNAEGNVESNVEGNVESQVATEDTKVKGPFPGLINYGVNCYLNTLLQCLFMTPEFRDVVLSWTPETLVPGTFVYELKQLFVKLKESGNVTLDLRNLINTVTWFSKYEQQDLLELWHIILDNFECSFQNRDEWLNIRQLFEGLCMDYVKCLSCGTVSKRTERFYELSLDVKVSDKIYNSIGESLSAYIQPELLSGSNQYKCGVCNMKCNAEKGLAIVQLPYIMLLHLKRYEFTEMFRRKLNNQVTYPDYLNLAAFMQKNECIIKQNSVEAEASISGDSENNYDYELYFVVLHLGSARTGHFSAYVKSLETQKWFLFNDRGVYEMTSDVWSHAFGENKHGVVDYLGCAYVLGYRQVNKNRNVTTVESVITPVRHNEPQVVDIQETKSSKRSFIDTYVDIEISADVIATVYCFLKGALQPSTNVVKVYCETKTDIRELKSTVVVKFHLDNVATTIQYRLMKFNPVMRVIECSCDDEDMLVSEYYNPVFVLEQCFDPSIFIPFTEVQLKLYQINAVTGTVSSDIELLIPVDISTTQLLKMISKQNKTTINKCVIIDPKKDVIQLMPKNSDTAVLYMDMLKSRYYVMDDAAIPKDIDFFKSDFAKIIRAMRNCVHVTLRYSLKDKDNLPPIARNPGKASIKRGVFYSWPSTAPKIDGYEYIGITVELNTTLSWLYNNVAHLIGVGEQYFDLYVCDVSHVNCGGEKLKCGSMTLKNALSNPNFVSYTPTYEILAEITFDAIVTVFLLDLNKSTDFSSDIDFKITLPCSIGHCKKIAVQLFKDIHNIKLKYDRCRLRKLSQHGITNVYDDTQQIDKFMTSFAEANYQFCIQNVPQGQKLCSKLPDSVHLFVAQYHPKENKLDPVCDMFLRENSGEEFADALSLLSDIPKEYLLVNLTNILLPRKALKVYPESSVSWLSVQSRMYTWRNKIIYDGKVIFYKDSRED